MKKYNFTIVTSTYNCGEELFITANSIRSQNRDDIQWIIIDANSTDTTKYIISQCKDLIDTYVSEKDSGIYDAWNKAITFMKGEWILFLGAGDSLYSINTIAEFDYFLNRNIVTSKLIYGKIRLVNQQGYDLKTIGIEWNVMKNCWQNGRRMLPVHPEVFHHRTLFVDFKFDIIYKIAGDSDFLLRVINSGIEPLFINQIITKMVIGGTSQAPQKYKLAISEINRLNSKNNIEVPFLVKFRFITKLYCKYFLWWALGDYSFLKFRMLLKK